MKFKIILDKRLSLSQLDWISKHVLDSSSLDMSVFGNVITMSEFDVVNVTMYLKRNNINYSHEILKNI